MPANYGFGRSSWGSSSSSRSRGTRGSRTTRKTGTTGYKAVCNQFNNKIASYRTLCNQANGRSASRPSPTVLNTMGKWVDKGAVIKQVSNAQLKRWSKTNKTFNTATAAKNALTRCFGKTAIKAVAPSRTNNSFIVACAPTVNGRKFNFPR